MDQRDGTSGMAEGVDKPAPAERRLAAKLDRLRAPRPGPTGLREAVSEFGAPGYSPAVLWRRKERIDHTPGLLFRDYTTRRHNSGLPRRPG
jgi:hypothetical protein